VSGRWGFGGVRLGVGDSQDVLKVEGSKQLKLVLQTGCMQHCIVDM